MWPYWLLFLIPAFLALKESRPPSYGEGEIRALDRMNIIWWGVSISLILIVGLRHEVGGDWFNYLYKYQSAFYESEFDDWWLNDPGYRFLEWIAVNNGWDIHAINFMGSCFFTYGLVFFCRQQPRPWLALVVAVPYLVIILGMGYSRQGIALGCIMAGLVFLGSRDVRKFVFWTLLGATFHKSAVLVLPMAALAASRRGFMTWSWVGVVCFFSYLLLLEKSIDSLEEGYLEAGYQSEGALVRLLMNALPAVLLLWKTKRFALTLQQKRLWFWFSVASLALVLVYFFSRSSTAVDRVGLYLLPLQLMVFSHLPEAMTGNVLQSRNNNRFVPYVVGYYALVQLVWFYFATHAFAWLPYRWYPLEWYFR